LPSKKNFLLPHSSRRCYDFIIPVVNIRMIPASVAEVSDFIRTEVSSVKFTLRLCKHNGWMQIFTSRRWICRVKFRSRCEPTLRFARRHARWNISIIDTFERDINLESYQFFTIIKINSENMALLLFFII
jgi:hypothetical protein